MTGLTALSAETDICPVAQVLGFDPIPCTKQPVLWLKYNEESSYMAHKQLAGASVVHVTTER